MIARRAAEILAGVRAGTYRFAPDVDPRHGAAWPPGWKPQPYKPLDPRVAAGLDAGRTARAVARANAALAKAGPFSKRKR